eukprot:gene10385-8326_t
MVNPFRGRRLTTTEPNQGTGYRKPYGPDQAGLSQAGGIRAGGSHAGGSHACGSQDLAAQANRAYANYQYKQKYGQPFTRETTIELTTYVTSAMASCTRAELGCASRPRQCFLSEGQDKQNDGHPFPRESFDHYQASSGNGLLAEGSPCPSDAASGAPQFACCLLAVAR